MKYILFSFCLVPLWSMAQYESVPGNKVRHISDATGVVVSAHPLASQAGVWALKQGGNAYDAAIATQWALAVVYPQAGNIGGGGFMVARDKKGIIHSLDYREMAPEAAHKDLFIRNGKADTQLSQKGGLASGVPGSVAGIFAMHHFAKLPMKTLIRPAISLAEKGFYITTQEANNLNRFRKEFLKWNEPNMPFIKKDEWKTGDILIQNDLAKTLKTIEKNGVSGFYSGWVAESILKSLGHYSGLMSIQDLYHYQVKSRPVHQFQYNGHEVLTMSLPSSGGILLHQMLEFATMENLYKYKVHSAPAMQIMIEAERRAYADRSQYMGDPDFVKDFTSELTHPNYLKSRWSSFNPEKATPSEHVSQSKPSLQPSEQTTHLSVIDKEGNAVSITTTLNDAYGSKLMVTGAGFLMNNEMDDFAIQPGVPNMYGAIGNDANAVEGRKRMLSSMTPTIVLKDNKLRMIVGTPGGTTIPTSIFQVITGILDFKLLPEESVFLPRFHHQWQPEWISIEPNFPLQVTKELETKGYSFKPRGTIGRVELIHIDHKGITGVADPRGDDAIATENDILPDF